MWMQTWQLCPSAQEIYCYSQFDSRQARVLAILTDVQSNATLLKLNTAAQKSWAHWKGNPFTELELLYSDSHPTKKQMPETKNQVHQWPFMSVDPSGKTKQTQIICMIDSADGSRNLRAPLRCLPSDLRSFLLRSASIWSPALDTSSRLNATPNATLKLCFQTATTTSH